MHMFKLNKVTIGGLSGIAGGIGGGTGARLPMRIGALLAGGRRSCYPVPAWPKGLIFGAAGALIFVAPPFLLVEPEGELAIVSPLIGLSLSAPLPVAYGLVVAPLARRLDQKYHSTSQRRVGVVWFALFALALFIFLVGVASLAEATPFPPLPPRPPPPRRSSTAPFNRAASPSASTVTSTRRFSCFMCWDTSASPP